MGSLFFFLIKFHFFVFQQELTEINIKLKNEINQLINESHSNKQELQQVN